MSHSVYGDRHKSGIGKYYLLVALGSGVTVICGDKIGLKIFTDRRDLLKKDLGCPVALSIALFIG